MVVFLIVILLLAALAEYFSLRGGAACLDADFMLSKSRTEPYEPIEITTTVQNLGRVPITYSLLRISFPLSARLPAGADAKKASSDQVVQDVFRLWSRKSKQHSMSFQMERRGVYSFGGREICRGDFLGLHLSGSRFPVRRTLLVYPPRLADSALEEALGSYTGEIASQRWLIPDPNLTLGVREYTGREPMHTISWSQTARRGALTVREFDFTRSLNCRILLLVHGLKAEDDALLDCCCSAVRTICEALTASGVEAQLYTNAALSGYARLPFRAVTASQNREEDLLEVLARVTPVPCSDAALLAETCLSSQTETAAYLIVAPHADEQALGAQQLLASRTGLGAKLIAADTLEVK